MKKYGVTIPVAGYVYVEVEAESAEEAEDKAFEEDFTTNDIEEWDLYHRLVQGNVCYVHRTGVEVEELDSDWED